MTPGEIAKNSVNPLPDSTHSLAAQKNAGPVQVQPALALVRVEGTDKGQQAAVQSGRILPPAEAAKADAGADKAAVQSAVSDIADYVQTVNRDLEFSIDDHSGRIIVKVLDSETQQIIRQIPSEEALSLARKLQEGSNEESGGLLFRDNA